MFKKILFIFCITATSWVFAQVDVNKSSVEALNSINGIGPAIAKRIVDERVKRGNFKDWVDFENRVKSINAKKSIRLSQSGLLLNGRPKNDVKSKLETRSKSDK